MIKKWISKAIFLIVFIVGGCSNEKTDVYQQLIDDSKAFLESADLENALAKAEEAIQLNEKEPSAYAIRGFIKLTQNELNQAKEDLSYAVSKIHEIDDEMDQYSVYVQMGNLMYFQENYEESLNYYHKALTINAEVSDLYNTIGLVYAAQGDYEAAIKEYFKALELDDGNYYAYGNVGKAYLMLDDPKRALTEINTAFNLYAKVPEFYVIKGKALIALERLEEAERVYLEAISIWEDLADAYYDLGDIYLRQGDYLASIQKFSFAKDYGIVEGYLGMGYCYRNLEQYEDAIKALKEYQSRIEGVDLKALYEMGLCYFQLGNYQQAITIYEEYLAIEENTEIMLIMGYAYEQLSEYDKAYDLFMRIIEMDPNHEDASKELAFIEENHLNE